MSAGSSADGLTISAKNVVVKGLSINGWSRDGVEVKGSSTTNTTIQGNLIGTDANGLQKKGNGGSGVYVLDTPSTVIGGPSPAARNVISANLDGVTAQASNTKIQGNLIGTDRTGRGELGNPLGNYGYGVYIDGAPSNVIGGTSAGARNVISANRNSTTGETAVGGVVIHGTGATNNRIEGNFIGTDKNGFALGNSGTGILVDFTGSTFGEAHGNRILRNSIFANGRLGIDLGSNGVTLNDPGDGDTGVNNRQNFPQINRVDPITKLVHHKRKKFTLIKGILNSTPGETFTVQFFSSPVADPSGYGEGKTFAGELTKVSTDQNGNAAFTLRVARGKAPVGSLVTATATNNSTGDTSEFSLACTVGSSHCPWG